jgi:hypothetical protein
MEKAMEEGETWTNHVGIRGGWTDSQQEDQDRKKTHGAVARER